VFGSHRSHGEIIAKCLSSAAKLPEKDLSSIMEATSQELRCGSWRRSSGTRRGACRGLRAVRGACQIFGRAAGFNKGMGGSMTRSSLHSAACEQRDSRWLADIAVGAALFKRINRKPGIVIANIGDGSSACGPVWEAMSIASMTSIDPLGPGHRWSAADPLTFFNNFYGMGGQTQGETMGYGVLARIGAGVNADKMHAERVDGYNLSRLRGDRAKKVVLLRARAPCCSTW